ncbi:MAG: 8-amino-7-oxononanoate synthase [Deltaproteobacteria bacterium]|nr:8-amino-7-oxononanoate synthase [Deltaproteobacteria bacterium]
MDVFQKCAENDRAAQVRAAGLYAYYRELDTPQDPVVHRRGGPPLIMLGSNNYLGLASHPEVKKASGEALERYGTGCAGSRLLNGTLAIHEELEERLVAFTGREAVLTFATGFQVNLGVLSALLDRHSTVFLDALDHASLIDGARLGFGSLRKYRHNDLADLARKLGRTEEHHGKLIAVDAVFSMEGDLVDLPGIVEMARAHEARILLDEAHGVGVFGARGRGVAEHFDLEEEVDLVMGTFSKSLAAVGGYVAGPEPVIDYLRHHSRPAIFSAAPPPASAGAVIAALHLIEREPERRARLWDNTSFMKRELQGLGFDTGESKSPVIPLMVGSDETCFAMVRRLEEEGVFANPVVSPAVPAGNAMIRTSYMATHTREHLERALEALSTVGRELAVL